MVLTPISLQNSLKNERKHEKKLLQRAEQIKKIAATKRKQSDAKRVLTMSSKKLAKLEGTDAKPKTVSDDLDLMPSNKLLEPNSRPEPLPGPQTEFLAAPERAVLSAGQRAVQKIYSLIADPLRYFSNGNFNGLVFAANQ